MRVLQVVTSTQRRGAEVFAGELAQALRDRTHEVTTLALSAAGHPTDLPFEALEGHRLGPRALGRLRAACRDYDVVVAHGGNTLPPTALAAVLANRPFVYRNIGDPSFWGTRPLARLRVGAPLRRATGIIALYRGAEDYLVSRYHLREDRLVVISNSVDERRFPEVSEGARRSARADLGLRPEVPVIGFLGALSREKRPEWAVRLAPEFEECNIVLAGDGPLRPELESQVEAVSTRCGGEPRVRLVGGVRDPAAFLAAVDVLVIPSVTEGVPGALVEAALSGIPVVATDVGGVREVISVLGAGLTVDVQDFPGMVVAIRRVLQDPGAFRAERQQVVEMHDLGFVSAKWERALEQTINRYRGR